MVFLRLWIFSFLFFFFFGHLARIPEPTSLASPALAGDTVVKKPPANVGDASDGSIPGSGRSPGVGNGNLFWYSCLGNSVDRGAWQATVHGVTKIPT